MAVILESTLIGEFMGFRPGNTYCLADGSRWRQEQALVEDGVFRIDPPVKIYRDPGTGRYFLEVVGVGSAGVEQWERRGMPSGKS